MARRNGSNKGKDGSTGGTYRGGKPGGNGYRGDKFGKTKETDDVPVRFQKQVGFANDPSWYLNVPAIADNVNRIPFALAEGDEFNPIDEQINTWNMNKYPTFGIPATATNKGMSNQWLTAFPGIMNIVVAPTFGVATKPSDPINVAAQQTFTVLRNASSGQMNFDAHDLITHISAVDQAYSMYAWMSRVYKKLFLVDYQNKYLGDALIASEGVNPALRSQAVQMEAVLNYFTLQLSRINIPDVFDIIKRHAWMFSHVYKDSDQAKGQLYQFVPFAFYTWDESAQPGEEQLKPIITWQPKQVKESTGSWFYMFNSPDDFKAKIDAILDPIFGSESFGQINGRMATAYGLDKMVKVSYVTPKVPLTIDYSMEVMMSIENATPIYMNAYELAQNLSGNNAYFLHFTTKTDEVMAGPYIETYPSVGASSNTTAAYGGLTLKRIMNMHKDSPTIEDIAVASRLTAGWYTSDNLAPTNRIVLEAGTEVCLTTEIISYGRNPAGAETELHYYPIEAMIVYQQLTMTNPSKTLLCVPNFMTCDTTRLVPQFDWAPIVPMVDIAFMDETVLGVTAYGYLMDVDNYAFYTSETLHELHKSAILSLWINKDYPATSR